MTRLPDESISFQNTTGDSGVENLYVYGKLNYDFKDDDITVKSINVTSPSIFTGDVTFSGDITLDEITCRNANVTGVATVGADLYLNGKLFDGDGDFGAAGQILSSDGTDLNWIDASTTSVANANNVGVNLNSTNADQFITFVGASSGNNPVRVDAGLKYNPSTNILTAPSFSGNLTGTIQTAAQTNITSVGTLTGLTVNGNITQSGTSNYISINGGLKDKDGDLGSSGQVLSSTGTQVNWIDAFSGAYNDLTGKPTLFSGNYNDLSNQPTLFSGAYNDLSGKPTLFSGNYNDLSNLPTLFSGNYNDLSNLPTLASSLVAQARSASDSSTSTQFNPVGYVDKLTLTVSNVQSTSKILLFFRMALGHSGSGTTLGRVTGPSLFGGDTTFETGDGKNTHGILFDTSNSTTRTFKIQYADNGGVSSTISNTELFAVEIKVS